LEESPETIVEWRRRNTGASPQEECGILGGGDGGGKSN